MAEVVNLAERKVKRRRQRKYIWTDRVKADPRIHQYRNVGGRFLIDLAELLASFSSFEREGVYGGRGYLANRLGVLPRQVSRGTAALQAMNYLEVQRRGKSTNLVVPVLDGERLYPAPQTAKPHSSMGHTERQDRCVLKDSIEVSQKTGSMCLKRPPSLLNLDTETENQEQTAPQTPQPTGVACVDDVCTTSPPEENLFPIGTGFGGAAHGESTESEVGGEIARSLSRGALDGEVLHPSPPLMFADFWNSSRWRSDDKDKPGPARLAFDRLSDLERTEIASVLDRDGRINLGGMWTVVWLRTKAWREAPLGRSGRAGIIDRLDPSETELFPSKLPFRHRAVLKPGTPAFAREFERRRQAGEDLSAMQGAIRRNSVCTLDVPIDTA